MNSKVNNNGYNYVDLGLPSHTLWATCNIDADKPTDVGLYFHWGDSKGYTKEQLGKDKAFSWSDYKFSLDSSFSNFSKYTTASESLELADDAAHVNMGGDWHMPTPTQIKELIDNTINAWTTQDGVKGWLFTSKTDNSKSIFIPAAGYASNGSLCDSGSGGYVWSSTLSTYGVGYGQFLDFYSDDVSLDNYGGRCNGFSVRGVIG